jgi:glycolate oxidase FAD binding subunit
LYIRLSGSESGVRAARAKLGGQEVADGERFWHELREQELAFFRDAAPLWRLSLPPATPMLDLPGQWLLDWGGAQRWLKSAAAAGAIHAAATGAGGHTTPFRNGQPGAFSAFELLPFALAALHARLQRAFDPHGIFRHGLPLESAA